jgi:hypothetical protein
METVVPEMYCLEPQGGARRQKYSKFLVAVLRCGQCVVRWWLSYGFNARESVGDNVVLSRYMSVGNLAIQQHGTHGGSGDVCDECKLRGWLGVRQ